VAMVPLMTTEQAIQGIEKILDEGGVNLNDGLCGCGRSLRYMHFQDNKEVMSCNKYMVCPTYEEQECKVN